MRGRLAMVAYVVRHLFLGWFLSALIGANLEGGPVDDVLQPLAGHWIERLGLRQSWKMFAPNPTHFGSFTHAYAVTPGGRVELPVSMEPPYDRPFFRLGYDRLLKFEKLVNVVDIKPGATTPEAKASAKRNAERKRETYDRAYAEALCRIHGVRGSVALEKVLYYVPSPSRRLAGRGRMRITEPLGEWRCP